MTADQPGLHPAIEPLAFLLGAWRGNGHGEYPTIEAFDYVEEVTFGHVGKPFVAYVQRTRDAASGLPLHAESGYFRPAGAGRVELVVAQPSGIVEVDTGSVVGQRIMLASEIVATAPTAKECAAVQRTFEVIGDELVYELSMAAMGQPMTHHLSARLQRV